MDREERQSEINQVTERIITCVYRVSNTLGSGFLEKVYENALAIELRQNGLKVEQQHAIRVFHKNEPVGDFAADLLVEDRRNRRAQVSANAGRGLFCAMP